MTTTTRWIIGILTLIEAAFGINDFFRIYEYGLWVSLETYEGAYFFLIQFVYRSIIVPNAALVIGLSTLKNKQWSWRANMILQIATIAVLLYNIVPLFIAVPQALFLSSFLLRSFMLLELILASVILFLVLRRRRIV